MANSQTAWYLLFVLFTEKLVDCQSTNSRNTSPVYHPNYHHQPISKFVLDEVKQLRKEIQELKESNTRCQPVDRNGSPTSDSLPGIPKLIRILHGSTAVTALELFNQELFVFRRTVNQISVYDTTTFRLKRRISVPGLGEASWGMAACNINNYLYISDHWNHQVHVIDLSDDSIAARWNVGDRPAGLYVTSKQNVLVAYTWIMKVEEYTPTGTLVRELALNSMISIAVELDAETWIVSSDGPSHSVTALRKNGQVIANYGNQPGSADGQLNNPHAMTVDKKFGNVVVADFSNHRVMFINSSLSTARVFPFPANVASLTSPISLCMDFSLGRLYVGEDAGQKRILIFDNVTNIGAMFE